MIQTRPQLITAILLAGLATICPRQVRADPVGDLPPHAAGTYITLDVPGSSYTYPTGVNDQGDVVGSYQAADGNVHGFVKRGATFTTVDVPGASYTTAMSITGAGKVFGAYIDEAGVHGFTLSQGGLTSYDSWPLYMTHDGRVQPLPSVSFPGAASSQAVALSSQGDVVGYRFYDQETWPSHTNGGFVLKHGVYTAIDVPGVYTTGAEAISDSGIIVGSANEEAATHGFLYRDGSYSLLDAPGASSWGDPLRTTTFATGVNTRGDVVGNFYHLGIAGAVESSGFLFVRSE